MKPLQKKNIPSVAKDIKDFLLNEEGKISKNSVVKVGATLSVLLFLMQKTASAQYNWYEDTHSSGPCHDQHTNDIFTTGGGGHSAGHSSHSVHCNTHTSNYYDWPIT